MSTDPAEERERPPYWIALVAVLCGFAAAILFQVIVALIGTASGVSATHQTPAMNNADNYLLDLSFVGSALYFTKVSGVKSRLEFGYRRISLATGLAAVLAAAVAYYVVTVAYSAAFSVHGTDKLPSGLGVHHTGWAVVLAVYVCAVAPMAEELFFRGFLFGLLRRMRVAVAGRQLGPWIAAAIVGVLFGLAHYDSAQPEFLIPLGFLGFVLCIVRWRTGSLYPCMALHSLNNSVAFLVNEHLGWGAGGAVALTLGSLAVIALVTGPFSAHRPASLSEA
jgi:hypothetical protein